MDVFSKELNPDWMLIFFFNQKMSETYCECKKAIYFLICHDSS